MSDDTPARSARTLPREQPHLRDYLRVLTRRWGLTLTVFLLVALAAVAYTMNEVPTYEARARLIVEPVVPVAGAVAAAEASGSQRTDLETHYQLLQSRSLARTTINQLGVWDRFEPAQSPPAGAFPQVNRKRTLKDAMRAGWAWVQSRTGAPKPASPLPETEERAQARAVSDFLTHLKVAPVQDSRLIEISFRGPDPALAAQVVNTLATAYISEGVDTKVSEIRESSEWLAGRLAEQRKRVAAAEAALQSYRERNDALSVEGGQNIVVQKLADLNSAVTKVKTERLQREAVYRQVASVSGDPHALDSVPAVLGNTFIQQQRADLASLLREQAQLSERLGDRHPEMTKVKLAIQNAQTRLRGAVEEVVQSLRRDYESALAQEESLTKLLNQQKAEAQSMNRKGIAYAVLQRDVESSKQVYDGLLQRAQLTAVSSDVKTSNVRIVDMATEPEQPLGLSRMQILLLALFGGVVLAVSGVFFAEYLDTRIRTPEAVEAHLRLMPLGLIPRQPRRRRVGALIDYGTPSPLVEAFRGLRTNVLFSFPDGPRSLVVTSASPGEGKTLIAANLAVGLAQSGQRVVMLDADLRRPHVHRLFGLNVGPGLSDFLSRDAPLKDVVQATRYPGLKVITAGEPASNPAELVGSSHFSTFLARLEQECDVVVIDTPPVMAVADASIVAHQSSSVLFVVAADTTSRQAAQAALDQLERARGKFLGAVLNRTDSRLHRYFRGSYFGRAHRRVAASATH